MALLVRFHILMLRHGALVRKGHVWPFGQFSRVPSCQQRKEKDGADGWVEGASWVLDEALGVTRFANQLRWPRMTASSSPPVVLYICDSRHRPSLEP